MFLCCMATSFAQFSGSGSGTENDPYLILNPIQLNQMRNFLNQKDVYFKLMADIDLTEFLEDESPSQGWQPVGTSSAPFNGVLDGNGHKIMGLWINRPNSNYIGLFAKTGSTNATIKNLTLENASVNGKNFVGLLVGESKGGNIVNCTLCGKLSGNISVGCCVGSGYSVNITEILSNTIVSGLDEVGGIIGKIDGNTINHINNCIFSGSTLSGNNYIGGICGTSSNTTNPYYIDISNCYVTSNIVGNEFVGGLCGKMSGIVKKSEFRGDVTANSNVGGICGYYGGDISEECCSVAYIKGQGNRIGGLFGETSTIIRSCFFCGNVIGNESVGGLTGYFHSKGSGENGIEKSYSNSKVSGTKYVGGLCGFVDGKYGYTHLYSNIAILSSVKATDNYVGRIYGMKEGSEGYVKVGSAGTTNENKAWNRAIVIKAGVAQDVEEDAQNGTGVSATTLKLKATYVGMGWDFTDLWTIQETECYPYFKTQTAPPVITSQVVSGATSISGKCVDGGTITLEIDGVKQQLVSTGNTFSFTVSPLQAGHEVRISAKIEGKEQSYYTTEVVSYLGKGTEDDPYQIYTASDLTGVYRKGYFKLMNDIDLTSYINQFSFSEGWESIGREGSETIHFDGNGHKITGLWCNSTRDNTGLFSCFANGTIKNLTVETAKGKQVKGGANTGILIGKMINGTIENCRVSGAVADGTPVGGLVGLFDGGKISLSQANVTINTTNETSYVGGLVGEITGGEIDQCVTQGTITATGNESYVGGLVGKNSATVTNCYSNAKIMSSYNAAGLVAYNYSVVDKCYATGDLFTNNYAAGVIGYNDGENAVVSNCVAMNNKIDVVYESQQTQQGGGYGQRIIGGIKNNAPAPELNNYALKTMQVSVNDVAQKVYDDIMNGAGKTGSELMKKTTYQSIGWDFANTWSISEGESYPALKNNVASVIAGDNTDDGSGVNTLSGVDLQTSAGSKVVLPINLNNENEVKLCQFDLQLPAGVTVATKSNGKLDAKLTERAETHTISSQQLSNGNYRFIISSMDNDSFTGNSGTLVEITLDIPATMEAGEYTVKLLNAELSVPDGNDLKVVKPADTESKLTIKAYTPGDVNNDGSVSVTDVGCAINYILEQVPSVFIFEAADMNGDKNISVTDVGMIINLILNEGAASPQWNRAAAAADAYLTMQSTVEGYQLQLENKDAFIGFQMDVQVANGAAINDMKLMGGDDHLMTYRQLANGTRRVVCYSPTNNTFLANDAALLNIATNGNVTISNVRLTTADLREVCLDAISGGTTGITDVKGLQGEELKVYSLDGRLCRTIRVQQGENPLNGLKAGVYMIGNRKVVVR